MKAKDVSIKIQVTAFIDLQDAVKAERTKWIRHSGHAVSRSQSHGPSDRATPDRADFWRFQTKQEVEDFIDMRVMIKGLEAIGITVDFPHRRGGMAPIRATG